MVGPDVAPPHVDARADARVDPRGAERPIGSGAVSPFLDALRERVLVFDGAFGTWMQGQDLGPDDFGGLSLEGCNEHLVLTRPDLVGPEAALWALLLVAVVVGIPQGIVNLAIQNTLYHQADPTRMGATSGLLRTFMYLGAMLASAATGAFFHTTANTAGLHDLAWFMLGAAVIFLVITLVDRSLRRVDRLATGKEE